MVDALRHKLALLVFVAVWCMPLAALADTSYGHSTYGSGPYGGLAAPDTTDPIISSISSGTPGQTSVTIMWTTDEAASSTVSYGLTTSYGAASSSPSYVTSHSITITGLTANTLYHYRIMAEDAAGNIATSSDQTFTTAAVPDTTPPTISSISSGTPGVSSATITWTTNEAADSQLAYGTTASYGATTTLDSQLVTSHSVPLSGLSAATTYHFRIRSADNSGNARFSNDQTFTTASAADTTDPSVSITEPDNNDTVSGNVTVSANASDNIAVASVSFYADGVRIGSEDTTSAYSVVLNSAALANGVHTLVASARDTSNNYATSSSISITVSNVTDSGGGGGRSTTSSGTSAPTPTTPSATAINAAVTNLILTNRDLFVQALNLGISLPPVILTTLGLTSTPQSTSLSESNRNLALGSSGADVRALQVYLNTNGYLVAETGPGAPGQETMYFGPATQAALARFQAINGITPAVGYYGPLTRAFVNAH